MAALRMMRWIWQSGETALADMAALHLVISAGMDLGCGGQAACASSDFGPVAVFAGKVGFCEFQANVAYLRPV